MFIRANGLSVHYEIAGHDGAPVIAFVHGLAASAGVWDGQAKRLADNYRVLRYDLRSHGSSEAVRQPCGRADLADDLVGLLDALEIDAAVLVGHSAGGVVAMQTALDHPRRVSALVLVGTASECNDKTADWYTKTAGTARIEGGGAALRALGLDPDKSPVPDGAGFARLAFAMCTLNSEPLTEKLATLSVPTLIVVGEKDFLGVGGSVILSRAIGGSELEIVPGRGHGIYREDPDWFAARVRTFLAGAGIS